jgi:hypothetical protein
MKPDKCRYGNKNNDRNKLLCGVFDKRSEAYEMD